MRDRFKDRPQPPIETAIYWIEYVIRHKGANFLKTAAVDMSFYQYYLLDVFAFLLIVFGSIIYIIFKIFRYFKCDNVKKNYKNEKLN